MACHHRNLRLEHKFAVRGDERMYQVEGHCADCGAPITFEPAPSLSLDGTNLQIPFRMGAPDPVRLLPKPIPGTMVIGGARKGMH